jgi:hypothetical protein
MAPAISFGRACPPSTSTANRPKADRDSLRDWIQSPCYSIAAFPSDRDEHFAARIASLPQNRQVEYHRWHSAQGKERAIDGPGDASGELSSYFV